jgi:hypothetical protein
MSELAAEMVNTRRRPLIASASLSTPEFAAAMTNGEDSGCHHVSAFSLAEAINGTKAHLRWFFRS